jgi:glycosyltransferase involved in cell wall biosynthesis
MPPVRSGIAACSADLIPALRTRHEIDVFVDQAAVEVTPDAHSAHDFLWRHRRAPYDLTVYQVGNSSLHDYLWPYLFRYPGLTVLHDAHLHHARAAALLRSGRVAHYRTEFAASHPQDPADAAELAVAGFDSYLYYYWPMTRLVVERSRLAAVHGRQLADQLSADTGVPLDHIRLSHGMVVSEARESRARRRVRETYGIDEEAITFGCFGGLTPEKRLPQILDAFTTILPYVPGARLLMAGSPDAHYDVASDVRRRGLAAQVTLTGYLATDEELTDCIAAVDATLNLRWPTAREVSGPWLRSLAAGKPSIVIDLLHMSHVPSVDPRTWVASRRDQEPVTIAIDILDEDHSLRLAMRRVAQDAGLRQTIGAAARRYWLREHSPEVMLSDYERSMEIARAACAPARRVPPHLVDDGTRLLERLIAPFGLPAPVR